MSYLSQPTKIRMAKGMMNSALLFFIDLESCMYLICIDNGSFWSAIFCMVKESV